MKYERSIFEMKHDGRILPRYKFVKNIGFTVDMDAFILVNEPPHVAVGAVELNLHLQ